MNQRGIVLTPYLVLLVAIVIGLLAWRLAVVTGQRDVLVVEKTERERRDGMRDAANLRNRERTDEGHAASRRRAAAAVVRIDGPGIKPGAKPTVGGDDPIACFDRGRLNAEIAGWNARFAERLTAALRGHAGGLEGIARAGEGVAADYRACAAWGRDLN